MINESNLIQNKILQWYENNKRSLPWRINHTPYETWISETMLQQTQMERGVVYFLKWMERFPNVESVAEAKENEIFHYWEGLGYYRRAKFIHQAAKKILSHFSGQIPQTKEELLSLPGVGEYTASAILSIAYNQDIVTVDANVKRFFSRLFDVNDSVDSMAGLNKITHSAYQLLPKGKARTYNQAIMELGALICRKVPLCLSCPVCPWCKSYSRGTALSRPVSSPKAKSIEVYSAHGILIVDGKVLIAQRDDGLWNNLWEFPGLFLEKEIDAKEELIRDFKNKFNVSVYIENFLGKINGTFTNHKLHSSFYRIDIEVQSILFNSSDSGYKEVSFVDINSLNKLAMPSHHRKMASRFFKTF